MSCLDCSRRRLGLIREAAASAGAGAMYVRDTANIEWATAFQNVFDDEQAHGLFVPVAGEGAVVHTDSRYVTAMQREAEGSPVEIDAETVAMGEWAASCVRRFLGAARDEAGAGEIGGAGGSGSGSGVPALAIEDSISLHEYRALQKAFAEADDVRGASLVETHDAVVALRAVKDAREIEALRAAQAITDAAFSHIAGFIRPGMTERQVQLELDDFMLRHGAEGLAFPSIVASGANGASPHAIVSDKPLEAGECIVMDFGARARGYCSDMTRTVFLGEPEGDMLRAWQVLREANETVEAMLRPGVTGKEAHELALAVLDSGGFGGRMGHGLGHGVGIEIHELPVLSPRNDKPLAPGNVVTVEPGIYLPGRFGMRLEDFGVVTPDGFDVFTRSTHEMVVL